KPLVYSVVDQMPEFQADLSKYMVTSLRYPKAAMKAKKEGRAVLRFTVDEKGAVKDVHTVKSLDPALDEEAIRVVKAMPDWKPGRQNGKAVAVYYTLPVMFKLKEKEGNVSVKSSESGVFTYVDQMPEFKGDIKEYLVENLKYP